MAQKTRSELISQSDSTFQDAPPANITPPNHRQFNTDTIDSAAMVADDNTFTGENTFGKITSNVGGGQTAFESNLGTIVLTNGGLQVGGDSYFTGKIISEKPLGEDAIFVENGNTLLQNGDLDVGGQTNLNTTFIRLLQTAYNTATLTASGTIDMSNIDGNICFIDGGAGFEFNGFSNGNVGTIIYATFVGDALLSPTGLAVQPFEKIYFFSGDTLIFAFQQTNQIRILGIRRANNDYFTLSTISEYNYIRGNDALQIGSWYVIPDGYVNPPTIAWSIKVLAITQSAVDSTAFLKYGSTWYPALIQNQDLSSGGVLFNLDTSFNDAQEWNNFINDNPNYGQWNVGSSATIIDNSGGAFVGKVIVEQNLEPINRNLLNTATQDLVAFGRIKASPSLSDNLFYPHHGRNDAGWGNNPLYDLIGFDAQAIVDFNDQAFGNTVDIDEISAIYKVTNDAVTIYVYGQGSFAFNESTSNRSMVLYFPLPFACPNRAGGHGAVNFQNEPNHPDIGGIVSKETDWSCVFISKYSSAINTPTLVIFSFEFTYLTNKTVAD